jgi:hypothetical protein
VYLTHDECSLTGWRIEQSSCRPIDQDRHLQHHMAKRFHNAFSLVLHHDVSRLDYTQADGRPQIQIPMHLRGDVSLVTRTLEDPRWASGALQERRKQGGRRIRIRKARAQSKIGGKYAYKCCSHELELLYVRFRERSESVDFCPLDSGRVGFADSSQWNTLKIVQPSSPLEPR